MTIATFHPSFEQLVGLYLEAETPEDLQGVTDQISERWPRVTCDQLVAALREAARLQEEEAGQLERYFSARRNDPDPAVA